MAASVEGGQTFQRSIDMYRRDARAPLSAELDRVMAEVAVGSDLVVALENMAERSGVEDLKWAVEAVRIQQSTGGRLAPILHTLADFMRTRQEVRREVQTLSAEGRMSGYVLFAIPLFLVVALEMKDPGYLQPMLHGVGLIVLIGTAGLMALGFWIVRKHGQHQGLRTKGEWSRERGIFRSVGRHHAHGRSASPAWASRPGVRTRRRTSSTSSGRSARRPSSTPNRCRLSSGCRRRWSAGSSDRWPAACATASPASTRRSDIDRVHADLLKAGLTGSVRAEEFVAIQVGSVMARHRHRADPARERRRSASRSASPCCSSCRCSVAWRPATGCATASRLGATQVTNDLPDLLDLMTISVAAGLGLEQAMQVSCARFESPVCDELRLTLREMELGLSRHDALENMKLRTDIDDLVTFAVVLSQADALGLPIGRVLQAQADEMRDKRRQRAREKAAKVPVKILFPLAFCFLPAIMIVVLGPIVGPDQARLRRSADPRRPASDGRRTRNCPFCRLLAPGSQSGCTGRLTSESYNDLGISTALRWRRSRTGLKPVRNEGDQ